MLTDTSTHEELNRSKTFGPKKRNPYRRTNLQQPKKVLPARSSHVEHRMRVRHIRNWSMVVHFVRNRGPCCWNSCQPGTTWLQRCLPTASHQPALGCMQSSPAIKRRRGLTKQHEICVCPHVLLQASPRHPDRCLATGAGIGKCRQRVSKSRELEGENERGRAA